MLVSICRQSAVRVGELEFFLPILAHCEVVHAPRSYSEVSSSKQQTEETRCLERRVSGCRARRVTEFLLLGKSSKLDELALLVLVTCAGMFLKQSAQNLRRLS